MLEPLGFIMCDPPTACAIARTDPPQKHALEQKDIITISISILALLTSLFVAYSQFGVRNQLLFYTDTMPRKMNFDLKDDRLHISMTNDIYFVNTGRDPIAITSLNILLRSDSETIAPVPLNTDTVSACRRGGGDLGVSTDFKPIIVAPKQTSTPMTLTFEIDKIPVSPTFKDKSDVLLCFNVSLLYSKGPQSLSFPYEITNGGGATSATGFHTLIDDGLFSWLSY